MHEAGPTDEHGGAPAKSITRGAMKPLPVERVGGDGAKKKKRILWGLIEGWALQFDVTREPHAVVGVVNKLPGKKGERVWIHRGKNDPA